MPDDTQAISERPIPLMLSIASAHVACVTIRRTATELERDGLDDLILTALCKRIGDELEQQITAGMRGIGLSLDEANVVAEELKALAETLDQPDR